MHAGQTCTKTMVSLEAALLTAGPGQQQAPANISSHHRWAPKRVIAAATLPTAKHSHIRQLILLARQPNTGHEATRHLVIGQAGKVHTSVLIRYWCMHIV
jgi:hypothetical protein